MPRPHYLLPELEHLLLGAYYFPKEMVQESIIEYEPEEILKARGNLAKKGLLREYAPGKYTTTAKGKRYIRVGYPEWSRGMLEA